MKWNADAEAAIRKVPFFVRKKVRATIEAQVRELGRDTVTAEDTARARKKFMSSMASDIKGYQCDTCFGASGCPNRIRISDTLVQDLETVLAEAGLLEFLKSTVTGDLKYHHEFRVTTADCPNACSQPQIKDMGIISARVPRVSGQECTGCNACVNVCRDAAISLDDAVSLNKTTGSPTPDNPTPVIDPDLCQKCGQCIDACPAGCLEEAASGYRVQLGGRLGRHPRLAMELDGIHSSQEVLTILKNALALYKSRSTNGTRFSHILTPADLQNLR